MPFKEHCHTPIFDLEYSLSFQRKIRQRDILKYLIFGSLSGPLFILSYFIFILIFTYIIYFIFVLFCFSIYVILFS